MEMWKAQLGSRLRMQKLSVATSIAVFKIMFGYTAVKRLIIQG